MSAGKSQKLKKVLDSVPAGYLVDAVWFTRHGVAYETFRDYVKRGWLDRVVRGVFRRPVPNASASNTIAWNACLISMQYIMGYEVHAGGTTALSQKGYDHYLRLGSNAPVWVYGEAIPKWLGKLPLDASIETRNTSNTWPHQEQSQTRKYPAVGLAIADVCPRASCYGSDGRTAGS